MISFVKAPHLARAFCLCALTAFGVRGQGLIDTIAGGVLTAGPGQSTRLSSPWGIAVDASRNVFLSDNDRILRIDANTGLFTTIAGGGPDVGDGPALSVALGPGHLVLEKTGNLLLSFGATLRRLDVRLGRITTIAGQYAANQSRGDGGPAKDAYLSAPEAFCVDAEGNIYIAESGRVRRIDSRTGIIDAFAGSGDSGDAGDGGDALSASFRRIAGVAVDSRGDVYISDFFSRRIRKVDHDTRRITAFAALPVQNPDGPGGLAFDASDHLYVITLFQVWKISASGEAVRYCGVGQPGGGGDGGPAAQAQIGTPYALAFHESGDLFLSDPGNRRVRLVRAASGVISTVAGTSPNGDGGLAVGASLYPIGMGTNAGGDLLVGEPAAVRRIDRATGIITTVAGGGRSEADGVLALEMRLAAESMAVDRDGGLLIGESARIRRVGPDGTVTTIAGTGAIGFGGDGGPAREARVWFVSSLAVDAAGNIYFGDGQNFRVRRIDAVSGVITTVAGNGKDGFSGEGGPASETAIGMPAGLTFDNSGTLYFASLTANRIFRVSPSGVLSVAGGNGGCGHTGDGGPARLASMCRPQAVAVDPDGNIFAGSSVCWCVRRIDGATGVIRTIAGVGTRGFGGDKGFATEASLTTVRALLLAGSSLYIADEDRIRAVTPPVAPSAPGRPGSVSLVHGASYQPTITAPGAIVSLLGNYLGPADPREFTVGPDGRVTPELAGVRVFIGGLPAPLLYVSAGQVNAITPYGLTPSVSGVPVRLERGSDSATTEALVRAAAPAIFPSAVVNEDGSRNDAAHPAAKGSTLVLYGTGLGQTTPPGVDGSVTPPENLPVQVLRTSAQISAGVSSATAEVLYAGPAPGMVAGVFQVNLRIPANTASGENRVQISAAGAFSPAIAVFVK